MVSFVLSLISVLFLFFSYELSFVLGIVSIIVAVVNKKKQNKLTISAIVISSVVLLLSIIFFCKEVIGVKNIIDETNNGINNITEKYNNK